jgi:hypothetical protein
LCVPWSFPYSFSTCSNPASILSLSVHAVSLKVARYVLLLCTVCQPRSMYSAPGRCAEFQVSRQRRSPPRWRKPSGRCARVRPRRCRYSTVSEQHTIVQLVARLRFGGLLSQIDLFFPNGRFCGIAGRNTPLELDGQSASAPSALRPILTRISISPNVRSLVSGYRAENTSQHSATKVASRFCSMVSHQTEVAPDQRQSRKNSPEERLQCVRWCHGSAVVQVLTVLPLRFQSPGDMNLG